MTPELAWVLLVLLAAMALFATERLRMDMVALLALLALAVPGIVTVPQALAGFADPTVIMVAGLFVVGSAIFRTGLADTLGRRLEASARGSYPKILALVMLTTAGLSAFLSSTGTVALMLPIVMTVARRARLSPSLLLIPTAYAALLGGMLTLIATAPNMIASGELVAAGFAPLRFFDFTGPGLVLLGVGMAFMLLLGRRLLPERVPVSDDAEPPGTRELWARYGLTDRLADAIITPGSSLADSSIAAAAVRSTHQVRVVAVASDAGRARVVREARPETIMRAGDTLTVKGSHEALQAFAADTGVRLLAGPTTLPAEMLLAEVVVPPASRLIGETAATSNFRHRYGADIMAVLRGDSPPAAAVSNVRLQGGDALLLLGSRKNLSRVRDNGGDIVMVTESRELREARFNRSRAPWAVGIMLVMLAVMAFGLLPNAITVLLAAAACVLAGCLDMDQAYRDIDWRTVILLACLMPLATALQTTGGTDALVAGMGGLLAGAGNTVVLLGVFALTAALGLVISNTATAVLVAPVAVQVGASLGLDPRALAMMVALAASAAFVTPVSSPVNMLVVSAGGYRFGDFVRVGVPLLLVVAAAAVLVVPLFFPL